MSKFIIKSLFACFFIIACGNNSIKTSHLSNDPILKDKLFSDSLKISDVLKFSKASFVKNIVVQNFKKVKGFDFCQFEIELGDISTDDYYQVGFNDQHDVVSVDHFGIKNNFKMKVFYLPNTNARIMFVDYFGDNSDHPINEKSFIKGVFILVDQKLFFWGKNNYDIPIFQGSKSLSSIMSLDKNLSVIKELRLQNNRVLFKGKLHYTESNNIKSERIFVPAVDLKISDLTTISELEQMINVTEIFYSIGNVELQIVPENTDSPIWLWEGNHDFK